jgi:HK97 family phage major capsid protein
MTTGSNTLVGTEHRPDLFIDQLQNASAVIAMGATRIQGISQNLAIPRMTAGSTAYWMAEDASITQSTPTFDNITLSPKQLSAHVSYSRKLLLQALPDIELLMRNDLTRQLGLALDAAALKGTGTSNQPLGLLNVAGIGSVAGGTNGAAPTWANVIGLESAVASANADVGSLGYLTNAKVRAKLKQTEKASSTGQFVWENGGNDGFARVNGYRAMASNQVPSNLTKGSATGVCSAIVFGDWSSLLVGEWGAADIIIDQYTEGSKGNTKIYAHLFADVAVRHPESFAAMLDALTA